MQRPKALTETIVADWIGLGAVAATSIAGFCTNNLPVGFAMLTAGIVYWSIFTWITNAIGPGPGSDAG